MKRSIVIAVLALCSISILLGAALAGQATAAEKTVQAKQPDEGGVTLEASVGLGYDSNVYEAPDAPYTDYAAIGGPVTVTPVKHSGLFLPVDFTAKYTGILDPKVRFLAEYDFSLVKYVKSENNNADHWRHKIKAGIEYLIKRTDGRKDTLYIGPYYIKHKENYYDHDTGDNKVTTAGEDVADRFSYDAMGFEAEFKKHTTTVKFGVNARYETRDYEDPVVVSQYDYSRKTVGGDVTFPIIDPMDLKLSYEWSSVDYDDRHARNESGQLFASAPLLQYTYNVYGVSLRNRLGKDLVVYLDYDRTDRTDEHVAYNDYQKDEYALRIIYTGIKDTRLRAKIATWTRDYPNAFAFDEAGQAKKEYDGTDVTLKGEHKLTKAWGIWAEYKYVDQGSTDLRYDYSKNQALVGVSWEH